MSQSEKIDALREYFERQNPGFSIETDWDFDRRAWTFRFDRDSRPSHILKAGSAEFGFF